MRLKYFPVIFLLASLVHTVQIRAQARTSLPLDRSWQFTKDPCIPGTSNASAHWSTVNLPHTWNAADVMDDVPGYYRAACWYRNTIRMNNTMRGKDVFLYFKGAGQKASVWINGKKAGDHQGGYTSFCFPVHQLLRPGNNEVLVRVDNSQDSLLAPLSADFTFYGGLYRDVSLLVTSPVHISCTDHAGPGIYIITPMVKRDSALVLVRGTLDMPGAQAVRITTAIEDRKGGSVAQKQTTMQSAGRFELAFPSISKPRLWSPEDPYLYRVHVKINDAATGQLLDEISRPFGFRFFRFDADSGFFLNGAACKLVGASRHQDYAGRGNALPASFAWKDMRLLKAMGANFVRIAHYPQDPAVLEACDSLGILASVEIPVVNEISESDSFDANCRRMQVEMIRQNFNHPSVVIWGYMNEIMLRPHFNNDKARQRQYFHRIVALAKSLDSLTRSEDPARYTMIANHGDFNRYKETGLTDVPMIVGWNLYSGWYGGTLKDFPSFLDRHHKELSGKPMIVTEYGADADPRIRSTKPVRFDKSVEYATAFHQYYYQAMMARAFVAGMAVWNLADFNSESRAETMPHINNKGLLTWDRQPKDPYYYYQAVLLRQPFLRIASRGWTRRTAMAAPGDTVAWQQVQVATNLKMAELLLNGRSLGTATCNNGLCSWNVPFRNGKNVLAAHGAGQTKTVKDAMTVDFLLQPNDARSKKLPFRRVSLLLGANRYIIDDSAHATWAPAQPYRKGSWGAVGGHPFVMPGNGRLPYGSDKSIAHTDMDPVYQTQLVGLDAFRFDVPDGNYELTLCFAELEGVAAQDLAYNLSTSNAKDTARPRIFDVLVNGKTVLQHFDMAAQYGRATAVRKTFQVTAAQGRGIVVSFGKIEGEPVLNAIQLIKK